MNDRQVLVTIVGGILSALFGGLFLVWLIQLLVRADGGHIDSGDDGWGLLWVSLTIISGITGIILSAKWARSRYSDFQA